ncbi:MAG TPA: recombinase family protein [Streptosporangiaceae bacterium]|jgi:hypothetical protein
MTTPRSRPGKRAISYLRARTVNGDDRYISGQFAAQRAVCQHLADVYGANIVQEFTAVGGAREPYVRHIVNIMCQHAAAEHADYVITANLDRLCRGPAEADDEVLHAIDDSGARLLCGTIWDAAPPGPHMDSLISAARRFGEQLRPLVARRIA